jgi:hypothetical protein
MDPKVLRSRGMAAALCGLLLGGCGAGEEEPMYPAPAATAVLQGTVTGLGTRRPVVLQNNGDADGARSFFGTQGQETVAFSFGSLPAGVPYDIKVTTQPFGKICTVANGAGVVGATGAPITVNCVNDPAVPRFSVSGTVAQSVRETPGARIVLTTEEGVRELPAAGLTNFTFPDALFNNGTSLPVFSWRVTAVFDTGASINNCAVTNGGNPVVDGVETAPTGHVTGVAITACSFTVTAAVAYSPAAGQPALPMPSSGMTLALRHNPTGIDVREIALDSFATVGFSQVLSNAGAIYELVVKRHPTGQTCIVGSASQYQWGSAVLLLNPADTVHGWIINRNVRCRARPAADSALRGTYQQATVTATGTTVNRNFLTFFEDGTYLYAVHGSGTNAFGTSGVEHGFYAHDPAAGTITFNPHTDSSGAAGLSTISGGVSTSATLHAVVRTPGPMDSISAMHGSTSWLLSEPMSTDGQMMGAWVTPDHRRVWVYNALNANGFHAGVNGLANLQDGCFNIEDPTAPTSYYTRRGNATSCSLGTGMFTIDMPAATTTPRNPEGFRGKWPQSGSNADGRPSSPVNFTIVPGLPDTLEVRETVNGAEMIDGVPVAPPILLERIRSDQG